LKEEALHRTIWRHRFGGGFGPVIRQNTERMTFITYKKEIVDETGLYVTLLLTSGASVDF